MSSQDASIATKVASDSLHLGRVLGQGGQGIVHEVVGQPRLVYKQYLHPAQLNPQALLDLVSHLGTVVGEHGLRLRDRTSWPLATVHDSARVIGVVMKRLPPEMYQQIGPKVQPRNSSYAIFKPSPMWGDVVQPNQDQRVHLARKVAQLFDAMHAVGAVYGDLSHANVAWTLDPEPDVFLMDCDAVRISGRHPALVHAVTPDWDDPAHPLGATQDSDRYKLAMFIGRMLTSDPYLRPGESLLVPSGEDASESTHRSHRLFRRAGGPPGTRPTAREWVRALT